MKSKYIWICLGMLLFNSCGSKKTVGEEKVEEVQTPVTVTTAKKYPLIEYAELNATAQFLEKNYVKANINGYVESAHIKIGQYVSKGQLLFVLKTKEAKSIGNSVNKLDPSFRFSGINNIRTTKEGYVAEVNHQPGDYVQDGEQLAVINDRNSFAFVMDIPYELNAYLSKQKSVIIELPDETSLRGHVIRQMPTVDSASQTQRVVVHAESNKIIPENLIAKIRIVKADHSNSYSLPTSAVLTNDVQTEYWVMKMIDSVTAVKTVIRKGIETDERIEILYPVFTENDRILISGNFGLDDTAKVKIRGIQR